MNEFDMYLAGDSIPAIHEKTNIPLSTLRFRFKKAGILRSRADGDKTNNDIDNLALMTLSGHARLHRFEDELAGKQLKRNSKGEFV